MVDMSSPGTTVFVDVPTKIFSEIFQSALKRFDCPGGKSAERISWGKKFRLKYERVKILNTSPPLLHCEQNLLRPRQSTPTRRAPTARFLRKEVLRIPNHTDRTS